VSTVHSHKRRLYLRRYAGLLLLSDETRADHKRKFEDWIRARNATSATELLADAENVIENMAVRLADSSALGTMSAIWEGAKSGVAPTHTNS
jgi:hypothetical protein